MAAKKGTEAHGLSGTSMYRLWLNIKDRCFNPKNPYFHNYGGRGITMCAEWRASFLAFQAGVGPRPSPLYQIDRVDNNGNYEPGNVRWATKREQALNMRKNRLLTFQGKTQPLVLWARELGLGPSTLQYRLKQGGLTVEQALSLPAKKGRRLAAV